MIHTQDALNWRDLQIALAFHVHGDLQGAARHLNISPSTVQRRIQALEEALGVPLCRRSAQGTQLSDEGRMALDEALAMRELAGTFLHTVHHARHDDMVGRLSITLPSGFVEPFCTHLPTFYSRFPNLELRVIESSAILDLSDEHLDMAIRVTRAPHGELWGRQLGRIKFAIHVSRAHQDRLCAIPEAKRPWITFDPLATPTPQSRWEQAHVHEDQVVLRTASRHAFVAALRAGVGVGIIPTLHGAQHDDLTMLAPPVESISLDLWLLAHQSKRQDERLRTLMDAIYEIARAQIDALDTHDAHPLS